MKSTVYSGVAVALLALTAGVQPVWAEMFKPAIETIARDLIETEVNLAKVDALGSLRTLSAPRIESSAAAYEVHWADTRIGLLTRESSAYAAAYAKDLNATLVAEVDLSPFLSGVAEEYAVLDFYTVEGGFAYEAQGQVAQGAKYQLVTQQAVSHTRAAQPSSWVRDYRYASIDGTADSGGEFWMMLHNWRQRARAAAPRHQSPLVLYTGFSLIGLVIAWRVVRKRQIEREEDLESYPERADGPYFQSVRATSSSTVRLRADQDGRPCNALTGVLKTRQLVAY